MLMAKMARLQLVALPSAPTRAVALRSSDVERFIRSRTATASETLNPKPWTLDLRDIYLRVAPWSLNMGGPEQGAPRDKLPLTLTMFRA